MCLCSRQVFNMQLLLRVRESMYKHSVFVNPQCMLTMVRMDKKWYFQVSLKDNYSKNVRKFLGKHWLWSFVLEKLQVLHLLKLLKLNPISKTSLGTSEIFRMALFSRTTATVVSEYATFISKTIIKYRQPSERATSYKFQFQLQSTQRRFVYLINHLINH